jgi:formylglycine-generating enzyme required for sulfatase activity
MMVKSTLRSFGISLGAMVLATAALHAGDGSTALRHSLTALVSGGPAECPQHMVLVEGGAKPFCIDRFEVSAGSSCPYDNPQSIRDSARNLARSGCVPVARQGETPWRFISRHQAQQACASAGKQLPNNEQWYHAALGSPAGVRARKHCNLSGDGGEPAPTGEYERCVSRAGTYDMIGNVWEWVRGMANNGAFDGRPLPERGYVAQADAAGLPTQTATSAQPAYANDYTWIAHSGTRGMMRGGFYRSGADGGLYSMNAARKPDYAGQAVGFRCVQQAR